MTLFWLIGAALALLALALILPPLLSRRPDARVSRDLANLAIYRDQRRELDADLAAGKIAAADHQRASRELEERVLEDLPPAKPGTAKPAGRWAAVVLGTAVPAGALLVYLLVGTPAAIDAQKQASPHQVEALVARLAERLRERPEDIDGWVLLGRSYDALGRGAEAAQAFAQAEKLATPTLARDPHNLTALALAGSAAFGRGDYKGAAQYWERMLALVTPGSEEASSIQANVDEARALAKKTAAAALRGTVRIAPQLKDRVSPEDTVFIFARAAEGPPMPLAVVRKRARELPASFALDDSMAMTPQMKLSSFARVVVGARISKSGNATPQPGDLQGTTPVIANTARDVSVVIDTEVSAK
jgi:cytochrome c-type biogenesis protein CcmH